MRFPLWRKNEEGVNGLEAWAVFLICCLFILFSCGVLFLRQRMFSHDTLWYFGLPDFFYNSLHNGVFPYWDIYDYCGQPFYYNLGIAKVFELPTIMLVMLSRIFNWSVLTLYHWDVALKLVIYALGVYMAFRQTNKFTLSNIAVFMVFMFSSFTLVSFRQPGVFTSFCWTGWIIWFLLRLVRQRSLFNTVGFSLFLGLSLTSYQAGYVLTYLQFFLFFILLTQWKKCLGVVREKNNFKLFGLGILIVFTLSLQALAVVMEMNRSVPVLRRLDTVNKDEAYESAQRRSPAHPADYLGFILPSISVNPQAWNEEGIFVLSECALYIGIIPLLLALLGIFLAKNRWKLVFLFTGIMVFLLSIEFKFALGRIADFIFPFLHYCRHMELFQPFFIFTLMYFVGQGMDVVLEHMKE